MNPRRYKVFNVVLIATLMAGVLWYVVEGLTIRPGELSYRCDGFGSVSICMIEEINNFKVDYDKDNKKIIIRDIVHGGYFMSSVYAYRIIDGTIYAIGELDYSEGTDDVAIPLYFLGTERTTNYANFLAFTNKAYLPKLVAIHSETGALSLYDIVADIPDSDRQVYMDMIDDKQLDVATLEVHLPEEDAATAREIQRLEKLENREVRRTSYPCLQLPACLFESFVAATSTDS